MYWGPTTVRPIGEAGLNFAHNANPAVEPLLQVGRQNPDHQVRVEAYQQVDRILNGQDFPYIYMGRSIGAAFTRQNVAGMGGATTADGQRVLFAPGIVNPAEMWLA